MVRVSIGLRANSRGGEAPYTELVAYMESSFDGIANKACTINLLSEASFELGLGLGLHKVCSRNLYPEVL